jgi:D-3-phosphoglycerate dehydrogenase
MSISGGDRARRRGDEHAVRQLDHDGEHAIALMFALARDLPAADASTQAGKWEKNRFMGVELTSKTLGLIGAGNIGSIVAERAIGLRMKVIAYDPFLTPERAVALGVEKVELAELLARADFITLHTPLTDPDAQHTQPRESGQGEEGRAHHQLRARRPDRRGGSEGNVESGHVSGAALDVVRRRNRQAEPAVSEARLHATRPSRSRPPKRRVVIHCLRLGVIR